MTGPEPPRPWYARNILPGWVPVWLAVTLLIAVGFGLIFGLFLEAEPSWVVGLVAGAVGFGLALVILSFASARSPNPAEGQRIAPPAVLRKPILTAVITLIPFIWMTEARISTSARRGGRAIVEGPAAELAGVVVVVLIVAGLSWHMREVRRRTGRVRSSDVLSLAVAVLMFGYGLVVLVARHS